MSTAYHPPTVDDVQESSFTEDLSSSTQAWPAPNSCDGPMSPLETDLAPASPSTTSVRNAHDNLAPQEQSMPADDTSTTENSRSRPRSATVRRPSSLSTPGSHCPARHHTSYGMESAPTTLDGAVAADPESSSDETVIFPDVDDIEPQTDRPTPPIESTSTSFVAPTGTTHSSGSSNCSGSTVTKASCPRRPGSEKARGHDKTHFKGCRESRSPKMQQRPAVLNYLEPDSPHLTPEAIQRSVEQSGLGRMPDASRLQSSSTRSSVSTVSSSFHSDIFSETTANPETDSNISQDHSAYGDSPFMPGDCELRMATAQQQQAYRNYGAPEMSGPQGNANLPHLSPTAPPPHLPGTHYGHPQHLPRPERLPLTGYDLIAAKLCTADQDRSRIAPIYRRFKALNHRLLLHLQDELAELEEELHHIDTADTQRRQTPNFVFPASRRQDVLTASELQWHKTKVLDKIGYKIGQYNQLLSSFKEVQQLPAANRQDVELYQAYLVKHSPIVEVETRFLDWLDDLIYLDRPSLSTSGSSGLSTADLQAPQARKATSPPLDLGGHDMNERVRHLLVTALAGFLPTVAVAFAGAFLLPILAFAVIPAFVGRMAVILLVAVGVGAGATQAGLFRGGVDMPAKITAAEALFASGVYVGVMAVVAGIVG